MGWERIYTIEQYWDGPILGVANFEGRPHVFECLFDDKRDEWSERYALSPIDEELLGLILEKQKIWRRWQKAFQEKQTPISTHPALPPDKEQHAAILEKTGNRLTGRTEKSVIMRARFQRIEPSIETGEVEWLPLPP